jgi:hypothetical protein
MSTVPNDGLHAGPEEISAELDAMHTVGHALARLHDPAARARVLRWAAERFETALDATSGDGGGMTAAVVTRDPIDQSVNMEGLHELFDGPSGSPRLEILHLDTVEPPAPGRRKAARPPNSPREAAETEPLDSLMRGLASDFQRFAVEWQSA